MKNIIITCLLTMLITGCAISQQEQAAQNDNENTENQNLVVDNTTENNDQKPKIIIEQVPLPDYYIYMVAPEDNGQLGKKIGCDDSLIAVDGSKTGELTTTAEKIKAAYEELLGLEENAFGKSGFISALVNSNLKLENVEINDAKATVNLSGELMLGGVCDNPRVEEQLTQTALQFRDIREVEVLINGKPLSEMLSLK